MTTRKRSIFERIVYVFVLGVIAALAAGVLVSAVGWAIREQKVLGPLGAVALSSACLVLCGLGFCEVMRVIDFHQEGAVERRLRSSREFLYDDAVSFTYARTRQYINGIYGGTSMVIRLKLADGRVLKFNGRYREHPKGFSVIGVGSNFVAHDEMDGVRELISARIAVKLAEAIGNAQTVEWTKAAKPSNAGVIPRGGRHKGAVVPWARISGAAAKAGFFFLFHEGEKKPFVGIPVNGANSWPAHELFVTLGREAKGMTEIPASVAA